MRVAIAGIASYIQVYLPEAYNISASVDRDDRLVVSAFRLVW